MNAAERQWRDREVIPVIAGRNETRAQGATNEQEAEGGRASAQNLGTSPLPLAKRGGRREIRSPVGHENAQSAHGPRRNKFFIAKE